MTQQEYNKEIEAIYCKFPSFQVVGSKAFKPGLDSMRRIALYFDNPQDKYKTIHIAGTNGKGSTSSMIASALMCRNRKVGLYTSPHLIDFRERIKINGKMIPQEYVYSFLVGHKELFLKEDSSFFEITTALAFKYFADEGVDCAVIECGLGGRLDSTNIITPQLSIITNIGLDHCQFLGHTLAEIASEKGGIIKPGVPVVLGESTEKDVYDIITAKAAETESAYYVADRMFEGLSSTDSSQAESDKVYGFGKKLYSAVDFERMDLPGDYQIKNVKTVATALSVLTDRSLLNVGLPGSEQADDIVKNAVSETAYAIEHTAERTDLRGRWERLTPSAAKDILIICDTGHNAHGFATLKEQIEMTTALRGGKLIMLFGVVADKDLEAISHLLPHEALYIPVQAKGERALPSEALKERLRSFGLKCSQNFSSVEYGLAYAIEIADNKDFIYIGGSTFVVAEAVASNFLIKK